MCNYRGIPHGWFLEIERGTMYKYLRMVAMEKTRSPALRKMTDNASPPSWLENTQHAVTTSRSLLLVSAEYIYQSRKKQNPTLHSTPIILLPSHSLNWSYIEDLFATLTQNKTDSNVQIKMLAHKPYKLGRKWGFRDTFIKAVKLRKQNLLLQEIIQQENTRQP